MVDALRMKAWSVLVLAVVGSLVSSAAATRADSPSYKVGFRFTAGGQPPVHPRGLLDWISAGKGQLLFDEGPGESRLAIMDAVSGTGFIELEKDYAVGDDAHVTFQVTGGTYILGAVRLNVSVVKSDAAECPDGMTGQVDAYSFAKGGPKTSVVTFHVGSCASGTLRGGKAAKVQVTISASCLRTTSAVGASCGGQPASLITVGDGKVTAGDWFAASGKHQAGELSCTGTVPAGSSECIDYANVGSSLTLTGQVNGSLPKGDSLRLLYDPGYSGDPNRCIGHDPGSGQCILAQTTTASSVQATVKLPPDKSATQSTIATVQIGTPAGSASRALLIGLCDPSKGEAPPHC
jgi:hypothetical protein